MECTNPKTFAMGDLEIKSRQTAVVEAVTGSRQLQNGNFDASNNENDAKDMYRLNRKQDLKRRFQFFSIAFFVLTLGLTWEWSFTTVVFSLANGGTAGAIWLTLATCLGMLLNTLTMAECASMAPTTGGQYHWVSEFAPPRMQKYLSYLVGWLTALGWQAGMPATAYIGAQQIVALIAVCDSSYVPQGWHYSLLTMAFVMAAILFNTFAIAQLPKLEFIASIAHMLGFFGFIITLWVMGPKEDAVVFFTFEDNNGWGSVGLATLIALVGPAATFVGADSAVHLGEELEDAAYTLPTAMISAAIVNYIVGFIATVTIVSNLGDLDDVLATPTGQPWVAVMQNATHSHAATIVFILVMILLYFFCSVNQLTTASRQLYAFARDQGVPFHRFFSRVNEHGIPTQTVYFTFLCSCLLALIIIGSSVAFSIILSLSVAGLYTSYLIVACCVLAKRLRNEPFPPSKFKLGRFGMPVNIGAVCFLSVAVVFIFFPTTPHPTPVSMNWTILMFGSTFLFSGIYYVYKANREYDGPVLYVRKDITG